MGNIGREFEYTVKRKITEENLKDLIIDGIETGTNYWMFIHNDTEQFEQCYDKDLCTSEAIAEILLNGGAVEVSDVEDKTTNAPSIRLTEEMINNSIEYGTWTPKLTTFDGSSETTYHDPTMTYTIQGGKYTKIGKLVYIEFYIRGKITALTGTENFIKIIGLPYSPDITYFGSTSINLGVCYQVTDSVYLSLDLCNNEKAIRLQGGYGANATVLKVTPTSDVGYMEIGGNGFYMTF